MSSLCMDLGPFSMASASFHPRRPHQVMNMGLHYNTAKLGCPLTWSLVS